MKKLLVLLVALFTLNVTAQTVSTKTITVEPSLSFQHYEHFNRLTLKSPNSNVEFIDGFDFEWGYHYTLSVQETKLTEPLSDGTSADFELIRVISKTKVADSTQFKLYLTPNVYPYEVSAEEAEQNRSFKQLSDRTYLYLEEFAFEVPEQLMEKFHKVLAGELNRPGTFMFLADKEIRLVEL